MCSNALALALMIPSLCGMGFKRDGMHKLEAAFVLDLASQMNTCMHALLSPGMVESTALHLASLHATYSANVLSKPSIQNSRRYHDNVARPLWTRKPMAAPSEQESKVE